MHRQTNRTNLCLGLMSSRSKPAKWKKSYIITPRHSELGCVRQCSLSRNALIESGLETGGSTPGAYTKRNKITMYSKYTITLRITYNEQCQHIVHDIYTCNCTTLVLASESNQRHTRNGLEPLISPLKCVHFLSYSPTHTHTQIDYKCMYTTTWLIEHSINHRVQSHTNIHVHVH